MARVRDRTEDFKEAVRVAALSHGYTEAQLAALMSSFIIRKPSPKSPFTNAAIKTLQSIRELERFIVKHRRDYVDLHRSTEQERDNIEHEVGVFVKACKEQIDILKNRIHKEEKNGSGKTWLGTRDESSRVDLIAHQHGVVVDHEVSTTPMRVQEQLLDDETKALQVELTSLLDAVQETETKMIEMSALNHLMSTHVLQQAQQIQYLYDQAVEATNNVERGNKELSQAIQRNSSSRTFLLLFFFVLTFSILFLDWYNN
ncbi:Syntaxin-81 [Zea mays]|uniref:Syntaxin-81 n=1 Tax=Zea mays TaxID=4577 RepID=A0A3L6G9E2_MAIZE|nr:Syntaxin-81 [Zea mays]